MNNFQKENFLIILVSLVALAFLVWLIYFNIPVEGSESYSWVSSLSGINAIFNLISATCLFLGYKAIKKGDKETHIKLMKSAFFFSFLFLIGYIIYHTFHGETKFLSQGPIRYIYFFILITHIILAAVCLPMVLITFYHAIRKNFGVHKKIAKWTYPIWQYVSVTGVVIYLMLKLIG